MQNPHHPLLCIANPLTDDLADTGDDHLLV
jgi:hypothetical protein